MSNKKIVLLAGKGVSTSIVFHALKNDFTIAAVILEEKESAWLFVKRRAKKLGWFTAIGQILFQLLVVRILNLFAKHRKVEILENYRLDSSEIPDGLVKSVSSVNSPECIQLLQSISPDAVVVNGTRIISKRVLSSIPSKFINMHAGITPAYRGVHGGYWALVNNDKENCGVTIHLVDAGVDTGNVLYQERIVKTAKDNFVTYPLLQLAAGLPWLKQAVNDALTSQLHPIATTATNSKQWYHPTIGQYIWHLATKAVC